MDDRVTAEAVAPAIAPLATAAPWVATTDGQVAAHGELADHGSLQQDQSAFDVLEGVCREEHPRQRGPETVELQHHGGHERLHR